MSQNYIPPLVRTGHCARVCLCVAALFCAASRRSCARISSHSGEYYTFRDQNFGTVEEDLYRAGQPNELNFPFMEKLNLKKVIWLAPEEPVRELYVFERRKSESTTRSCPHMSPCISM